MAQLHCGNEVIQDGACMYPDTCDQLTEVSWSTVARCQLQVSRMWCTPLACDPGSPAYDPGSPVLMKSYIIVYG